MLEIAPPSKSRKECKSKLPAMMDIDAVAKIAPSSAIAKPFKTEMICAFEIENEVDVSISIRLLNDLW